MCKELETELKLGKRLAVGIVRHLLRMGACKGEIPVTVDGIDYIVSVGHKDREIKDSYATSGYEPI